MPRRVAADMYACAAYPRRSETTREKSYSAAGQHDVLRTRGAGIHKSIHCCGSCCSCRCTLGIVITNTSHDDCCKVASTHTCSFHLFPPLLPRPSQASALDEEPVSLEFASLSTSRLLCRTWSACMFASIDECSGQERLFIRCVGCMIVYIEKRVAV